MGRGSPRRIQDDEFLKPNIGRRSSATSIPKLPEEPKQATKENGSSPEINHEFLVFHPPHPVRSRSHNCFSHS